MKRANPFPIHVLISFMTRVLTSPRMIHVLPTLTRLFMLLQTSEWEIIFCYASTISRDFSHQKALIDRKERQKSFDPFHRLKTESDYILLLHERIITLWVKPYASEWFLAFQRSFFWVTNSLHAKRFFFNFSALEGMAKLQRSACTFLFVPLVLLVPNNSIKNSDRKRKSLEGAY